MQLGNEQDTEVNHEEDDMLFYVRCNPRTTGEEASFKILLSTDAQSSSNSMF